MYVWLWIIQNREPKIKNGIWQMINTELRVENEDRCKENGVWRLNNGEWKKKE